MKKTDLVPAAWVNNLRQLMEARGLNPRSLSLKAGLNATAVRDMIEGRSRFPRYDTALALAHALDTNLSDLMCDDALMAKTKDLKEEEDLDLLTEIIARLQEIVADKNRKLPPRDFAAMAATIYRRMQNDGYKKTKASLEPQIIDLLDFEELRRKRARR